MCVVISATATKKLKLIIFKRLITIFSSNSLLLVNSTYFNGGPNKTKSYIHTRYN